MENLKKLKEIHGEDFDIKKYILCKSYNKYNFDFIKGYEDITLDGEKATVSNFLTSHPFIFNKIIPVTKYFKIYDKKSLTKSCIETFESMSRYPWFGKKIEHNGETWYIVNEHEDRKYRVNLLFRKSFAYCSLEEFNEGYEDLSKIITCVPFYNLTKSELEATRKLFEDHEVLQEPCRVNSIIQNTRVLSIDINTPDGNPSTHSGTYSDGEPFGPFSDITITVSHYDKANTSIENYRKLYCLVG